LIGLVSYAEAADPLPGEFIVRTYVKNTLLTAHDGDSDAVDAVVTTATSIGPYERFKLTLTPPNDVAFQTAGGHYLSASGNIRPGNGDPRRALQAYATSPDIGTTHFRLVNPYNPPGHTNIARPWMGYFTIQTSSPYFLTAVGGGGQPTAAFHTDALKPNTWEYFWVLKCGDLGSGYAYSFRPAGTGSPGQTKESWLRTHYYGEGRMRTYFAVIPTGYKLIRQGDGSYAFALETRNAVTYLTAVGGGASPAGTICTPMRRRSRPGKNSESWTAATAPIPFRLLTTGTSASTREKEKSPPGSATRMRPRRLAIPPGSSWSCVACEPQRSTGNARGVIHEHIATVLRD
jgi:hypothetical protein